MALKDIFKDSNDINEQSVAAFIAIGLVAMITISILISGLLCRELIIQEFVFISLLTFAAAALGIAGYKKINSDGKGK